MATLNPIVGVFASPGVSAAFSPPQANVPFWITIDGGATGFMLLPVQSIAGGPYATIMDAFGNPLRIFSPGAYQFSQPYTPPGPSVSVSYQLVCKVIGSGTCTWQFQQ
jgi:hypothetical protein